MKFLFVWMFSLFKEPRPAPFETAINTGANYRNYLKIRRL